jgi:pyruvate/2-oxoacid:ferredoxin oxidoreductase beta subunit
LLFTDKKQNIAPPKRAKLDKSEYLKRQQKFTKLYTCPPEKFEKLERYQQKGFEPIKNLKI